MFDTFALVIGLRAITDAAHAHRLPPVPEPEFRRFVFPKREAAAETKAANQTLAPRTLEELGVPRGFAAELESTFRAMGAIEGDRIVGFTFRTPEGVSYALRTGGEAAGARGGTAGKAA